MAQRTTAHGDGQTRIAHKSGWSARAREGAASVAHRSEHRLRDALERERRISETLSHAERMAATATLAAGVAHEINNPLTYVMVNVEHVLRRLRAQAASAAPEELAVINTQIEALAVALEGANRVRQVVRDLLRFTCKSIDHRTLVDVRAVLESALQMAWHELKSRVHVETRLRDVPPVLANEALLAHAFLSLLINAAQSIPDAGHDRRGRVTIELREEARRVILEVADTGIGIPQNVLTRIFDPFFTTRSGEARGMALAVAHGTVRALGGHITAESTPGKGTTVRIALPAAEQTTGVARGLPAGPRRVLVLDSDPMIGRAVSTALSEEHDVSVATSARAAVDRIARGDRFDIVLCDLAMPEMNGMEFYVEVLRLVPDLAPHVYFLTSGTFSPRARAFLEAFPDRSIEKPTDASKLREIVRRHR